MATFVVAGLASALLLASAASVAAKDRIAIVDEGGIRKEWKLADGAKLAAPAYPAEFAARGDNVCVAVGYAIQADGSTSDFSLLKAWASSTDGDREPAPGFWEGFAQAAGAAVAQWKFAPRPEVAEPRPVYTVATMHFIGREAADPAALRARCAISDLAGYVQKQKWDKYQAGNLTKNELQRFQRLRSSQPAVLAQPIRNGRR
ncbi:hypothetical protein FCE95_11780 [Luteimonas gilva]|uniref:Energy transducer TonB n=1 Tax=Luteimonas gilva TaxID=2572684 RepID=A0A4U5JM91_9GAMM|nr:hypothetical protein [Luteimonas gilva]TKR30772.1 hypothetical protein FCE95_11780 [Luteimonas gilva]